MADSAPGMTGQDERRMLSMIFCVDCSGSMAGERIGSLNWAARAVLPLLRDHAAEQPTIDLRLRVLRFASGAEWVQPEAIPVARFIWTNLAAGGETDMGAALTLIARSFADPNLDPARMLPPVIVLLSDGYPSDDAEAGLSTLLATTLGAGATRIPIAIGHDADLATLQAFSSDPALPPIKATDAEMLVSRIRWAAASPFADKADRQAPNKQPPDKPDDKDGEAESSLVW